MLSPVTWPVCAGGVPVSAEAPGRFLEHSHLLGSYGGHTWVIVLRPLAARWFWWVNPRRSRRWVMRSRGGFKPP